MMRSWLYALVVGFSLAGGTTMAEDIQVKKGLATAILGGGCFWCLEHDMQTMRGVVEVVSGYSGGTREQPTYENYHDVDAANLVPHTEVVQVTYDPEKVRYEELLAYYFRHIDATDGGGQFADRGPGYRPVIFVANDDERKRAEVEKAKAEEMLKAKVMVEILPAKAFWPAEEYHQDYANKNPLRYEAYKVGSGRKAKLEQLWGKNKKE